jgi:hypothetical protein
MGVCGSDKLVVLGREAPIHSLCRVTPEGMGMKGKVKGLIKERKQARMEAALTKATGKKKIECRF